jgi:hypothetical protein
MIKKYILSPTSKIYIYKQNHKAYLLTLWKNAKDLNVKEHET